MIFAQKVVYLKKLNVKRKKMISTANYNALNTNLQLLPEQVQIQVFDYVQYLVLKYYTFPKSETKKESVLPEINERKFGVFKGKIRMSADFNEPLDDFKEY